MAKSISLSHWIAGPLSSIEATNEVFSINDALRTELELDDKSVFDYPSFEIPRQETTMFELPNKSPDEIYYENAAKISFLLVEKIMCLDLKNKDGWKTSLGSLDFNRVIIALEMEGDNSFALEGICLAGVNIPLPPAIEEHRLRTLGIFLYKLFTRQNTFPDTLLIDDSQDENCGMKDLHFSRRSTTPESEDEEEEARMKALTILEEDVSSSQKKKKHDITKMETSCGHQPRFRRKRIGSPTFSRLSSNTKLPDAICRLISDLLDAANATKNKHDTQSCFTSMDEVLQDLHQMANDPCTFLHNNHDNQTHNKLDFGSRLFGREDIVGKILRVANRILSWDPSNTETVDPNTRLELISISGYSGSGKSKVLQHVGEYLTSRSHTSNNRWFFVQAKFDRMHQQDTRAVVASAFESYCDSVVLMRIGGADDDLKYCRNLSRSILLKLGKCGVSDLSFWIPSLPRLLDKSDIDDFNNWGERECSNSAVEAKMSQERLEYLFAEFVFIVLSMGRPVLLAYEDCHWADNTMIDFVGKLLKYVASSPITRRNLLYIQSFRSNEAEKTHMLYSQMSQFASNDSLNHAWIKLDGFSEDVLNNSLSTLLCLPRRLTASLSKVVHHKTMGNPLFVGELLEILVNPDGKKLLHYKIDQRRWVWDSEKIAMLSIGKNVANLLSSKLSKIDEDSLDCLIIASCFGSQVNSSIIGLIDGVRDLEDLTGTLDSLVEEGLIERAGPLLMFPHDSIQQAVYGCTPENNKAQLHFDIGFMMVSRMTANSYLQQELADDALLTAVGQINLSRSKRDLSSPKLEYSHSQSIAFAKLNLKAAQKSRNNRSDFHSAQRYLKFGLSFLKDSSIGGSENHWFENYDLSLALSEEYAYVMFVLGGDDREIIGCVNDIIRNAKSLKDSVKSYEVLILVLYASGEKLMACDQALVVLRKFGFHLPNVANLDKSNMKSVMKTAREFTSNLSRDDLSFFPLMTDETILQVMKIMDASIMPFFKAAPSLFPLLVSQMLFLTSKHGWCDESATAMASFGLIEMSLFRGYDEGYRTGMLAKFMLDHTKASRQTARIYSSLYGIIAIWKMPIQSTIDPLKYAAKIGFSEGDGENAKMCLRLSYRQSFLAGKELNSLRDDQEQFVKKYFFQAPANKIKMPCILKAALGDLSVTLALSGGCHELSKLIESATDETALSGEALATNESSYATDSCFHQLVKSFFFNKYDSVIEYSEKYLVRKKGLNDFRGVGLSSGRLSDIYCTFFSGLASFILSRNRNGSNSVLICKGDASVMEMQEWSDHCEWNFKNKVLLLKAEQCYAMGDGGGAQILYQESIDSAREHKFIHEEGIAHELFGYFNLQLGKVLDGQRHFEQACQLYTKWGAQEKVSSMRLNRDSMMSN